MSEEREDSKGKDSAPKDKSQEEVNGKSNSEGSEVNNDKDDKVGADKGKIEVNSNIFGNGLSADDYAKKALEWAKENISKKEKIYCPAINADVYVSNSKLRHSIYYKKHVRKDGHENEIISTVYVLEDLIKTAVKRYEINDKNNRADIVKIHKLKSTVFIDGNSRDIEITLRETVVTKDGETKNYFYYHSFI